MQRLSLSLICFVASILPFPGWAQVLESTLSPALQIHLCDKCNLKTAEQLARRHYQTIAVCRYEYDSLDLSVRLDETQQTAHEQIDAVASIPNNFYEAAPAAQLQYCTDVSQGLMVTDPQSRQLWWYHNRYQNVEQLLPQPIAAEQKPELTLELQLKTVLPQLAQNVQQLVVYSQQLLQLQQQVTAELQQTWQPTRINQARLQSQLHLMFGDQAAAVCRTDPTVSLLAYGMQPYLQQQLTARWQNMFTSQSASKQLAPWQDKLQFNQQTVTYLLPEMTQEISALQLHWPQKLPASTLKLQHSGDSWQWQMSYRPDWYADLKQDWPHHQLNGQPFSILLGPSQAAVSVVNPCWLSALALYYDSTTTAATADETLRWQQSDQAVTARQLTGHKDNRVCRYQLVSHNPQLPALRPLLSICPSP